MKKNKVERILFGEWAKFWPVRREGKTWDLVSRGFSQGLFEEERDCEEIQG